MGSTNIRTEWRRTTVSARHASCRASAERSARHRWLQLVVAAHACLLSSKAQAATTECPSCSPRVDVRMEILGIAFRLAQHGIANDSVPRAYAVAAREHFSRYESHPFIKRLKTLIDGAAKNDGNLGSWEIPSLALHIGPAPGFEPLVPQSATDSADGWDDRALLKDDVLTLLRRFYADSHADAFFASQQRYFAEVDEAFRRRLKPVDDAWLAGFFRTAPTESYSAVVSLLGLGAGDYIRVNFGGERRNTHTIIVPRSYDAEGLPVADGVDWVPRTMLHEMVHAYTNQLVDLQVDSLRGSAETIWAHPWVRSRVKGTFYDNWRFLLYESLVRAAAIEYLVAKSDDQSATLEREVALQEGAGFAWTRGLVREMERYQRERSRVGSFELFARDVTRYFAEVARRVKEGRYSFPGQA